MELPQHYVEKHLCKLWPFFVPAERTNIYREFIRNILIKHNCQNVLDAACGNGIDSVMLIKDGFQVTSTDASDKMVDFCRAEKENRSHDERFGNWKMKPVDWLSLVEGLKDMNPPEFKGYDAVICIGNSFPFLLPDETGSLTPQKMALQNFKNVLKPGGVLILDHRNYDVLLETGELPKRIGLFDTPNFLKRNEWQIVKRDHNVEVIHHVHHVDVDRLPQDLDEEASRTIKQIGEAVLDVYVYPHSATGVTKMIKEVFGPNCKYTLYGDYCDKDISNGHEVGVMVHVVTKAQD